MHGSGCEQLVTMVTLSMLRSLACRLTPTGRATRLSTRLRCGLAGRQLPAALANCEALFAGLQARQQLDLPSWSLATCPA